MVIGGVKFKVIEMDSNSNRIVKVQAIKFDPEVKKKNKH
jgi:hypothetical protein